MAGLVVTANGKPVDWVRDRVNMYAFHLARTAGRQLAGCELSILVPAASRRTDVSRPTSPIFPGTLSSSIRRDTSRVASSCRLRSDCRRAGNSQPRWKRNRRTPTWFSFKDTTLNTLIDSPVYAGVNFKRVDLSTGPDNPVYLDVFPISRQILRSRRRNWSITATWRRKRKSSSTPITTVTTIFCFRSATR